LAYQLLQPEGSGKAGIVVSTRGKDFRRTPPNQAGPLEHKEAFRILKRLATNPIREDQTSKLDYQNIQKDIACENERSAALYKAAINKVGEVYPGAKLAGCEAADIPSANSLQSNGDSLIHPL